MVNRVKRRVSCLPKTMFYKPIDVPLCDLEIINLSIEELEAIHLLISFILSKLRPENDENLLEKTFWNDSKGPIEKWLIPSPMIKKLRSFGEIINGGNTGSNFSAKKASMSGSYSSMKNAPQSVRMTYKEK